MVSRNTDSQAPNPHLDLRRWDPETTRQTCHVSHVHDASEPQQPAVHESAVGTGSPAPVPPNQPNKYLPSVHWAPGAMGDSRIEPRAGGLGWSVGNQRASEVMRLGSRPGCAHAEDRPEGVDQPHRGPTKCFPTDCPSFLPPLLPLRLSLHLFSPLRHAQKFMGSQKQRLACSQFTQTWNEPHRVCGSCCLGGARPWSHVRGICWTSQGPPQGHCPALQLSPLYFFRSGAVWIQQLASQGELFFQTWDPEELDSSPTPAQASSEQPLCGTPFPHPWKGKAVLDDL